MVPMTMPFVEPVDDSASGQSIMAEVGSVPSMGVGHTDVVRSVPEVETPKQKDAQHE